MASHLSQEFVANQKERLLEEKKKIMDEIVQLTSVDPFTDPEHVVDNAAVDSDVREQNQHMLIEAEVKELKRRLDDIIIALEKIEKGTYGVCEKTNQPIPESRLALIPEARFVVSPEQ